MEALENFYELQVSSKQTIYNIFIAIPTNLYFLKIFSLAIHTFIQHSSYEKYAMYDSLKITLLPASSISQSPSNLSTEYRAGLFILRQVQPPTAGMQNCSQCAHCH